MHQIEVNKTYREKATWKLRKNTSSYIVQTLKATPHKTTPVRQHTSKTTEVRRTRYADHRWKSDDPLRNDVLLWNLTHRQDNVAQPTGTYLQRLCVDTKFSLEDLTQWKIGTWGERIKEICAVSEIRWWWWCILLKTVVNRRLSANIRTEIIIILSDF